MTPLNGKKIVAQAWADPEFAAKLVDDTPAAIAQLDLPTAWQVPRVSTSPAVANDARRAQPGHLHAVLVLPVAGARAAALLVQGSDVPGPGGP